MRSNRGQRGRFGDAVTPHPSEDDHRRIFQPRRLFLEPRGSEEQERYAKVARYSKDRGFIAPRIDRCDGRQRASVDARRRQRRNGKLLNLTLRRPALAAEADHVPARFIESNSSHVRQ